MKIKVAVMFGGKSTEHDISIISAIQAINYLDRTKYDVIPVYITKDNEFYIGENIGKIESYTNITKLLGESTQVTFVREKGKANIVKLCPKMFEKKTVCSIDVILPVVHGTNVEDGTLQGFISMLGVPYVGCDVTSSAVGMDKYVMKTLFKDNNIPVLDCVRCLSHDYFNDCENSIKLIEQKISYPVIIKPVNLGSSIGISKASDNAELRAALDTAFKFADTVLAEKAIVNLKEINCSVMGDSIDAMASECEQPISSDEILSFNEKYLNGSKSKVKSSDNAGMASLSRKIPADISDDTRDEIRKMAVKAFKCLSANGVIRIDFMIDQDDNKIYLNEVNTIPGSLSFYLWEPIGMPYSKLLDNIINLAFKRFRRQSELTFTFKSNVLEGIKLGGTKGSKM